MLAVPAARRFVFPEITETRLRDHILFDRVLEDGRTVRCTDGTLFQIIEIAGRDISSMTPDQQEQLFLRRVEWLHKQSGAKVHIRIFTTRELHDGSEMEPPKYSSPELAKVMKSWSDSFRLAYRNRHFIILSVGGGEERARQLLREAVDEATEGLRDYRPSILELGDPASGAPSPLNTFLAGLLNPCMKLGKKPASGHPGRITAERLRTLGPLDRRLADHLINSEVEFLDGGGAIEVNLAKRRLNGVAVFHGPPGDDCDVWMGALGVSAYGDKTSIDLILHLLSLDAELTVVQHVEVIDDVVAEAMLTERANRSAQGAIGSMFSRQSKAVQHYSMAVEMIRDRGPDHVSLCRHQMTIFVYGRSQDDLDYRMKLVERTFQSHAMSVVRERADAETAWFSQFPPHRVLNRPATLLSPNIATCVSFESTSSGLSRCDWGPRPVTRFRTVSGAPYDFCWHRDDGPLSPGHTVVFGPNGAGKTFWLNFCSGATLGYDRTKVFLIDRSDGSYVSTMAFGGDYVHLQSDSKELEEMASVAQMNPLQMDLDIGHQSGGSTQWVTQWIRDFLCNLPGDDLDSEQQLGVAVRRMAELPREQRSLKELHRALTGNVQVKHLLKRWVEGEYQNIFNGAHDSLDFSSKRFFAFAFDRILTDPVLARAMLPYLAYRIVNDMERNGDPWLLILDEAAALIADERFRKWYFELLQEARKKRGVIVSAFQRISTLLDHGHAVAELVLQQCPNKVYLPNTEIQPREAELAGFTGAEYDLVTKRHPMTRGLKYFCLLKREGEGSMLLHTDFSPLGQDNMNLLMSGRSVADALRRLQKSYGPGRLSDALAEFKQMRFI